MTSLKNNSSNLSINKKSIKIALVGNPNCGKTTLFNQLTGSCQHVGNWPGVTVEKKEGKLTFKNVNFDILDLPGIYSLSPFTSEEIITRNSLIEDCPDLIINILDATILERSLYLTLQLLELGKPMIIAFNMTDIVEKRGDKIDYSSFKDNLNAPIIPISANKGSGIENLLELSIKYAQKENVNETKKVYSSELENTIDSINHNLVNKLSINKFKNNVSSRWLAIKIFENDKLVMDSLKLSSNQLNIVNKCKKNLMQHNNLDEQMMIADQRYNYIYNLCKTAIVHKNKINQTSITDKIDKFVTNKFLAIPIFLLVIIFIFYLTFGPFGNFFKNLFEFFIKNIISKWTICLLDFCGAAGWSKSLIVDGIITGVGSVISFLPQVTILFTLLSILEDSGYMSRAAFISDNLLRKVGLSGRAFIPLLMGFGCTVPAVLGTRILDKNKDKKLTILMIPFMSCSAKLTVYAMFIESLFKRNQVITILSIYAIGIIMAIFTAFIFNKIIYAREESSFIMELPDYKFPTLKNLRLHVGERVKDFVVKAGTILMSATIIIWFLQSLNWNFKLITNNSESILASLGKFIAPIFSTCGFGDWRASVSLLTGFIAKESVVLSMKVVYGDNLFKYFSVISAYSFMVFVLLYTPCVAAVSTIYKELKSIKWTILAICYQISLAWIVSTIIYQLGNLLIKF